MIQKLLIACLALVVASSAAVILLSGDEGGATVQIKIGGDLIHQIHLEDTAQQAVIPLQGENGIESTVIVEGGGVCIDHANCPDQICVNQGWITDSTLPIVCLPGEIIVEIVGGESSGLDTATG